jgi:hypothetical protein
MFQYIWIIANPAFFAIFWLLAVKYSRTAYEIPFIVEGKTVPVHGTFCTRKSTDRVMLTANIILAAVNGYFFALTHTHKDKLSPLVMGCYYASVIADSVLVLISGVMLIDAVIKIKKALGDMEGEINVKQLLLHSISFILFALGFFVQRMTIVIECAVLNYTCSNGFTDNDTVYFYATGLIDLTSFIS